MQGRYAIVLGSNPLHPEGLRNSLLTAGLEIVAETASFSIYASAGLPRTIQADANLYLLGRHRSRAGKPPPAKINSAKELLELIWGAFIAVSTGTAGAPTVTRDPSGQVPCYYAHVGAIWVFASDAPLIRGLPGTTFSIDWDELSDQLVFPGHFSAFTAIREIFELLPGETATLEANDLEIQSSWKPWTYCGSDAAQTENKAIELLQKAFDQVHEALVEWFEHPLLTVSGGLDSSIVACELHRASADARCLNLFTESSAGDERQFARIVTEACGYALDEAPYVAPDIDDYICSAPHLPRPTQRFMSNSSTDLFRTKAALNSHDIVLRVGFETHADRAKRRSMSMAAAA